MWFLHHFVRVIWSNILGIIYNIIYSFKLAFNKELRQKCSENLLKWSKIDNLDGLVDYIKNVYSYKYDGPKGFIDHNNYLLEWFTAFGDCDDVAYWIYKKLKGIYEDKLEYCSVHGFADLSAKPKFWHYDCVFKFKGDSKYTLFNYGRLNRVDNLNEALSDKMVYLYDGTYKFKKMTNWKCLWM